MSDITVSAGPCSIKAVENYSLPLSSFRWFASVFGIPCFAAAQFHSLPFLSQDILPVGLCPHMVVYL